jgi:hypothetical protein
LSVGCGSFTAGSQEVRIGEPKRFQVSEKALEFVYTYRQPYMSLDAMCAPLLPGDWTIIGVIYLDKRGRGGFEIEDMEVLQTISGSAAKLIHRCSNSRRIEGRWTHITSSWR